MEKESKKLRIEKNISQQEAKITSTNWAICRCGNIILGIIEPFDFSDTIDFVIISIRKEKNFGQFIFPKEVLLKKGIFSTETKEGKRATKVYPLWDITTSKQAQKTQQWQLDYFFRNFGKEVVNSSRAKNLFDIH